jgi:hypothetical protein
MKKMLLTGAMALMGLMVSAQGFMVTADIDTENFSTDSISATTDFGFGYAVNDAFTVGAVFTADENEDFRLFARYHWNESLYLTANTTTENFSDNLRIGAGYSFNVWDALYVEPNYTMALTSDENDERNAKFKLGLAYKF